MRSDVLDGEKRCTCWWDNDTTMREGQLHDRPSARTTVRHKAGKKRPQGTWIVHVTQVADSDEQTYLH